ncbi:MAG: T9SS type A sorting domain-containing protein [Fimbriimonadaceae bacterium]|nr:T9SS type A sorting domain-containing protein [Chitinophagales bacterium]
MKIIKTLFSLSILFISISSAIAQQNVEQNDWPVLKNSPNFYEVRDAFMEKNKALAAEYELFGVGYEENDDTYRHFKRWEFLMQTRVDANGNFPDPGIVFKETVRYKNAHPEFYAGSRSADWFPVADETVPSAGGGAGRINVIVLDPADDNIIYVGTASGGVWKSPDGGTTWISLTDNIPTMSIADIVIDPTNSDIIYIATGDGAGYEIGWQADQDFWGGLYSGGILKSTDGGVTWNPTGLSYEQDELQIIQKLIIIPSNTNILLAATRTGIYRTTDGGDTWSVVDATHCYDFTMKQDGSEDIYAVGDRDVLMSTDEGASFSVLKNNLCSGDDRMSIETTADNADVIYCLCASGIELKKSINGGTTWTNENSPGYESGEDDDEWISLYGYYDNVLAASHNDEDLVFAGGLDVARSINGAGSWSIKSDWWDYTSDTYAHADNHFILCHPTDVNIVYTGNDGGIFKSTDKGNTWVDLSEGLAIAQIYRISTGQATTNKVLGGWQDNGSNYWTGTDYERVAGGDGMEQIIDWSDNDIMFQSYQYGYIAKSDDEGLTWTDVTPSFGAWVTPYIMDPTDHMIMYYGDAYGDVYRSTNNGNTWSNKNPNFSTELFAIAVAPSDNHYVYAASLTELKRTDNSGTDWENTTDFLPAGTGINYIAVCDTDPLKIWIAVSAYSDGDKVYHSEDGGDSWTNVSGTLPNVPVNCIEYENGSNDRLYIGTDIGVFTKDNDDIDWEPYMAGLPNVMVHELEINYTRQKLVAATYGRGVWESDIYDFVSPTIIASVDELIYCPASDLTVNYVATGTIAATNTFTAQLSNETGSFVSPENIGSLTTDVLTGSIACTLPDDYDLGSGYRVRVTSSAPAFAGIDNGIDITISCPAPTDLGSDDITDAEVTLSWATVDCAEAYELRYKESTSATWIYVTTADLSYTLTALAPFTEYDWSVQSVCVAAPETASGFAVEENFTTLQGVGISAVELLEQSFIINPNPVIDNAVIQFSILHDAAITIKVLDVTGKTMFVLLDEKLNAGNHQLIFDKKQLATGNYMIELSDGENIFTRSVVVK